MRIAFPFVPGPGGHMVIFANLRSRFAEAGHEIFWLASGPNVSSLDRRRFLPDEGRPCGLCVAEDTDEPAQRTRALLHVLDERAVDVLVFNILGDVVDHSLAFYLPQKIRRLAIVHSISPMTYRAAKTLRPYMDAAVGVSPRIAADLIDRCGFEKRRTFCIPNAIDPAKFPPRQQPDVPPLRLLWTGRFEEFSKGVLWVPEILARVLDLGCDATLTMIGDGPDLDRAKDLFRARGLMGRVTFTGRVPPSVVAEAVSTHHVLLMTSRFEGFCLSLIEAMAGGCVPVASHLRGVTDFILDQGRCGVTFPVGSRKKAAACIVRLFREANLRDQLSEAARRRAGERFAAAGQAEDYLEACRFCLSDPAGTPPPDSLSGWRLASGLRPGWWYLLPEPLKARLRVVRERLQG